MTHEDEHLHPQFLRQCLAQAPPVLLGPEEAVTDDQALIRFDVGPLCRDVMEFQRDCIRGSSGRVVPESCGGGRDDPERADEAGEGDGSAGGCIIASRVGVK